MIRALLILCHLAAVPALALTAEEMAGHWESADGQNNTCADNPARLRVARAPDQVIFDWPEPMVIFDGSTASSVTYDLLAETPDGLELRLQGDTRLTDTGAPVIWVLRPGADRNSFCWGRTDWPEGRCDHVYWRCVDPAPVS